MANKIRIEVVCTHPTQTILSLEAAPNTSIREALLQSKLFGSHVENLTVGVFGRLRHLDFLVQEGDRIEVYRSLINDPKVARMQKVQKERRAKRLARQKK